MSEPFTYPAGCVAIHGRGVLIEGAPGSGKSSLALGLIDRGAMLVGDDGVLLEACGDTLLASPPPRIAGKLEVRNLGLIDLPTVAQIPIALVLRLDPDAPRFIEQADRHEIGRVALPLVRLTPHALVLPLAAERALARYGLAA